MNEVESDDVLEQENHEESLRVIAKQQIKEKEVQEAAGEDGKNGGFYLDHDSILK